MWLLIDDIRDLNVDVIARTGEAGMKMIQNHKWECILFDHDLGGHINGYEILTHAIEAELLYDAKIGMVTGNPVGREKMEAALENANYIKDNTTGYWEKK